MKNQGFLESSAFRPGRSQLADTHESGEAIFYMSDTGLSRVAVLAAALGDFEIGESGRYICSNKLLDYTTTTVVNKET
jgi:hypothetical protein